MQKLFVNTGVNENVNPHELATRFFEAGRYTEKHHLNYPSPKIPFDIAAYDRYFKDMDLSRVALPAWLEVLSHIEREIRSNNEDLLTIPIIANAIFSISSGSWQKPSLSYLLTRMTPDKLLYLLWEDRPLKPIIFSPEFGCSETSIVHLAQLEFFSERVEPISKMKYVIEFGAGYGSMTRLIRKLNPNCTIVIIDLPLMLILQKYYLENIFGSENVYLHCYDALNIKPGLINLVPILYNNILDSIHKNHPDLFIACFSLSEATDKCQNMIMKKNYFEAKNILISYYYKTNEALPFSTKIQIPEDFKIIYEGPTVFASRGEQLHNFARR